MNDILKTRINNINANAHMLFILCRRKSLSNPFLEGSEALELRARMGGIGPGESRSIKRRKVV
jgi:hypothetical protein